MFCILSGAWGFTKKLCSAKNLVGSDADICEVTKRGHTGGVFWTVGEVHGVLLVLLPVLDKPHAAAAPPAPAAITALAAAGPVAWRLMCLLRWSLLINLPSHTGQTNFFSPVCVRLWRESSSDRANFFIQKSKLHMNGFSPTKGTTYIETLLLHALQLISNNLPNRETSRSHSQIYLFAWKTARAVQ